MKQKPGLSAAQEPQSKALPGTREPQGPGRGFLAHELLKLDPALAGSGGRGSSASWECG